MHCSTYRGQVEAIEVLHRLGANVSTPANNGDTPIMFAAENGSVAAIESLARLGADFAAETPSGASAVRYAARTGQVAALDALVALGANAAGPMPGWAMAPRPALLVSASVRPPSIAGCSLRAAAAMMRANLPG